MNRRVWGAPLPLPARPRDEAPDPLSGRAGAASRQPVQTGSSGRLTKGLPEMVGSSPPRPLMNLFPLISGVAFEGEGWPRQLECPRLSSPGVLLPLPGHGFDRGLPDGPRVGLTEAPCRWKGNFPSCWSCLSVGLPVRHVSLSGPWGGRTPLLTRFGTKALAGPGGCPPLCRGRNEAQTERESGGDTHVLAQGRGAGGGPRASCPSNRGPHRAPQPAWAVPAGPFP